MLEGALAELFEEGEMQRNFNRARRVYHQRRDFLVSRLRARLGSALEFEVPPGGMAVWAEVDASIDVERWCERAKKRGLHVRSGSAFTLTPEAVPFIRLGFARMSEPELHRATEELAKSLR